MTEAEASFSEAGQSLKEKLLEKFKVVPEGFLDVGKDAAENFSSAFLDGLNKIMERAGAVLTAGIQPAYAASGAGAGNVQNLSLIHILPLNTPAPPQRKPRSSSCGTQRAFPRGLTFHQKPPPVCRKS